MTDKEIEKCEDLILELGLDFACDDCKHFYNSGGFLPNGEPDYNDDMDYCLVGLTEDYMGNEEDSFKCEGFKEKELKDALSLSVRTPR